MSKLITLAVFDNAFDIKYNLLKDMLNQAGIAFVTTNETYRTIKSVPFMTPANVSIDIKVDEENLEEAMKIYKSII